MSAVGGALSLYLGSGTGTDVNVRPNQETLSP
jgi:hypothetical protein